MHGRNTKSTSGPEPRGEARLAFPPPPRDGAAEPERISDRARALGRRLWRPAGTLVAIALAVVLTWHVFNGKHGLNVWLEKRAEDKQLRRDIQNLEGENARLRERVEHLKSDPDTIMIEARQKLHYAKPDEVIVALPGAKPDPPRVPVNSQK